MELWVVRSADEAGYARSDADGRWRLPASIGLRSVRLARGIERTALRVEIARGPNELGDVVLPFGARCGELRGVLRAPGLDPRARIELVSLETGVLVSEWTAEDERPDDGASGFTFECLPFGDYRLTVLSADGRRYQPREFQVTVPAVDLEMVSTEGAAPIRVEQRLHDASGARVAANLLARIGGRWREYDGDAPADVEEWLALRAGGMGRGALDSEGVLTARLEPGWGEAVLFREAGEGGAPVDGALVLVHGTVVATSDAHGLALVRMAEPPSEPFGFRHAGWGVGSVRGRHPTYVELVRE